MAIKIGRLKVSVWVLAVVTLSGMALVCWALPPGHWEPTLGPLTARGGGAETMTGDCPGELVCAKWVWSEHHGNGEGGSYGPCCLEPEKLYATYVGACNEALRHAH